MSETEHTREQLIMALEEIANQAICMREVCLQAVTSHGDESVARLELAACSIASQIGWIADTHSGAGRLGTAERWMLPPLYHKD